MSRTHRRPGLTLSELLVVIGIVVVVLLLFVVPAAHRVREANLQMVCTNTLKNLMLGIENYRTIGSAKSHAEQALPPGCLGPATAPEERLSWMVALLPYLDNEVLFKQLDTEKGFQANLPVAETRVNLFQCGKPYIWQGDSTTHYVAMAGIGLDAAERAAGAEGNGFMGYDRCTTHSMIKDGTSNTIALAETRSNLGPWARGGTSTLRGFDPGDLPVFGDQRPFGGHRSIKVAMADGSVHHFNSDTNPKHLAAWITIAGKESIPLDPN